MKKILILLFIIQYSITSIAQSLNAQNSSTVAAIKTGVGVSEAEAKRVYDILSYYLQQQVDVARNKALKTPQKLEQLKAIEKARETKLKQSLKDAQIVKLKAVIIHRKNNPNAAELKSKMIATLKEAGLTADESEKASQVFMQYGPKIKALYTDKSIKSTDHRTQKLKTLSAEREQKLKQFLSAQQLAKVKTALQNRKPSI